MSGSDIQSISKLPWKKSQSKYIAGNIFSKMNEDKSLDRESQY